MERGIFTRTEILSQPEAWAQALEVVAAARSRLEALLHASYDQVLFTGCGSTYYLSLAAASLFQELTHRSARAVPGSELLRGLDRDLLAKMIRALVVAFKISLADIFTALGSIGRGNFIFGENRGEWALGDACTAINARIRINVDPGPLVLGEAWHHALHRADFDAASVSHTQAGDDVSHRMSPSP